MMRLPWVETIVVTASSSSSVCWHHTPPAFFYPLHSLFFISLPGWFWSASSPFPPPLPREQCVCLCVYVCARARFLLFVDSVLSNSYRIVKGSSTHTHVVVIVVFFSSFSLHDVHIIQTPSECFLFLAGACFLLSLETEIYSVCIIWSLNEMRLSYIYIDV
jgi:hypothetical protein